jgi:Leucine-rich repeat (LRR) protein
MHTSHLRPLLLRLLLLFCCLTAVGCDEIKKWVEPAAAPPAPAPVAQPAPVQAPPPPVVVPVAPVAPSPEEMVAAFRKMASHQRNDEQVLRMANIPEAAVQITELDVNAAPLTDQGGQAILKFPNLKKLDLTQTRITNKTIELIATLPKLEELSVASTPVTADCVEAIAKIPGLKKLRLDAVAMTDDALAPLGGMAYLEDLSVAACSQVTGHSFTASAGKGGFKTLKKLTMSHTNFAVKGLEKIGSLPNLTILHLTNCGVSDVGLKYIAQCDQLTFLSVSNSGVTDKGVTLLAKIKTLVELELTDCRAVTSTSFKALKGLKELRKLGLQGTSCSTGDAQILKEKFLPDIQIFIDNRTI